VIRRIEWPGTLYLHFGPAWIYNLKVEHPGFKTANSNNVEVQVQQSVRLDFTLQVGQVSESVEVAASADLLQAENATVGSVVETKSIVELPLNGREYLNLVSQTGYDRPNYVTGQSVAAANQSASRWWNNAAFVEAPFGSFGNVGRDNVLAPGVYSVNAEVHKNWVMPYNEHHQVQFRAEAFNLFNHPNFYSPNRNILAGAAFSWRAGRRRPSGFWRHQQLGVWYPDAPVATGIEIYVLIWGDPVKPQVEPGLSGRKQPSR
jgi:hypothetical protein